MQIGYIMFGVIITFLSVPVVIPFLSLMPKLQSLGRLTDTTIRHRVMSAVISLVVSVYALGFTFQSKPINLVIALVIGACFLNLVPLIFKLKPRFVAFVLGIITVLLSVLVGLGGLLESVIDGKASQFKISSKLNCEVYQFGLASTQGGLDVTLYRKVGWGLNYKAFHESYLDEIKYPFSNPEEACKYASVKFNG